MLGLDAKLDMIMKAADVRRSGILLRKVFAQLSGEQMSGGGSKCAGFP